jgi:hypothetical protein
MALKIHKRMKYYAQGIRKVQKELGLGVDCFPNLGMYGTDEDGSDSSNIEEDAPFD